MTAVPTEWTVYLSVVILSIGLYGIFTRRSMIRILLGVELILGAATLNFIVFSMSVLNGDVVGHILTLFVIALAAAETIIGLILLIMLYKDVGSIDISLASDVKAEEQDENKLTRGEKEDG
ncbi:MAG: NADH-quinone oxidoreductase subunit NuoK [Candidatus Heimdallarchaeum aukensis]|uniref:NADH-quinone oxidoreductase subunit NuoK n=1 Tax=Candidatus Heimdallarchaeum aukensis TaxID=2876573 RepID=A0A9Y1BKM1_9ARCH|nr:MAG: NADH-quinone oxidoreductase subunit NuoK [Candidatus Heimdallarchaeum aukensis]